MNKYAYIIRESVDLLEIPKNSVKSLLAETSDFYTVCDVENRDNVHTVKRSAVIVSEDKKSLLGKVLSYRKTQKEMELLPEITYMKDIFDQYYGSENVDIISDPNLGTVNFLIFFKKIKVRNDNGQSLDIYDVYVCVTYNTVVGLFTLRGDKSSYTEKEINHGYIQSHLVSKRFENGIFKWERKFPTFCTGSDTFLSKFSQRMFDLSKEKSRIEFETFAISIIDLFSYESISGKPYLYINNVIGSEMTVTVDSLLNLNAFREKIVNYFQTEFEESITLKQNGGQIYIDYMESWTKFLDLIENDPENGILIKRKFYLYHNSLTEKYIDFSMYIDLPEDDPEETVSDQPLKEYEIISVSKTPAIIFKKRAVHIKQILYRNDFLKKNNTKGYYRKTIHPKAQDYYIQICEERFISSGILKASQDRSNCKIGEERFTYYRREFSGPV